MQLRVWPKGPKAPPIKKNNYFGHIYSHFTEKWKIELFLFSYIFLTRVSGIKYDSVNIQALIPVAGPNFAQTHEKQAKFTMCKES